MAKHLAQPPVGVDWDSPTWGHNPVHLASNGSWVPDRHEEE